MREQIEGLIKQMEENRFADEDLQIELCNNLYDIANECNDGESMGTALFYKGEALIFTNPEEAEKCIHRCIPLLKDRNYELLARAYNLLGIAANNRDDLTNSLDFYLKCFQICENHRLNHVKGLCSCNIGVIFQLLEMYEKSTKYFNIALDSFKESEESDTAKMNIVTIYVNLFIDYFNMHDLPMMKKCLDYIKVNRQYLETQFSVELFEAEMMYISGETEKLDETIKKAVETSKSQDMMIEFIDSYVLLCDFLHDLGKNDMLLEVLDLLEAEMTKFPLPRIRMNLIKHRLECIKENHDFDEYAKWTEEYIKTYELITQNYHQSVFNSIQLRLYIEKLKDSEQAYEEMAMRDSLTNLYNRYGLRNKADTLLQKATEEQQMVGVDIIDVDFFKQVNDSYGHSYGDECLKNVADVLKKCCPVDKNGNKRNAILSRYGGDEFVVFIRNINKDDMEKFAVKVQNEMAMRNIHLDKSPLSRSVTLSQGIVCKKVTLSDNMRSLIERADKALYEVKENGRNGYKFI